MWIWMVATLAPRRKLAGREGGMGKEKKKWIGEREKKW